MNLINTSNYIMNQDHLLLLKDSLKYAGSKVIPGLMGLVAVIVFVRMIGIEEYGKYSIQLSLLMVISSFAIHWLNASTLRYYSKYQSSVVLPRIFVFSISKFHTINLSLRLEFSIFSDLR